MTRAKTIPFKLPFTHYADQGYHPIPVVWGDKRPAGGSGWNTRDYDYEELDRGKYSVGMLCDNVVAFDIDVDDKKLAGVIERAVRKHLKLPKDTPVRVGQAPKRMLIARVAKPVKGWDIHGDNTTLFQLLGKGKQFVVHGIHPTTGKNYTIDRALPAWNELPLVTDEQLDTLKHALVETFAKHDIEVTTTRRRRRTASSSWSSRHPWTKTGMEQAWEALEGLDPDMSRPQWIKIGMAVHDGTHGSDEGLEMWDAWSSLGEKYKPGDCAKQWSSFKSGGNVTKATLFKNEFPARVETVEEEFEDDEVEEVTGFASFFSGNDLLDADVGEVPWIVEDVLTYGAHLLVGRPKGGKSWLTMDMAYAVANGSTFLDQRAHAGGVLWIASEDTHASLSRRLKVRSERFTREQPMIMTMESLRTERKLWDEETTFDAWLREFLDAHPAVSLVIMDTHATVEAVWNGDEGESRNVVGDAYKKSRIYDEVGQDTHTCIVLVHHTRKRNGKEVSDYHELVNLPATVVAGSTASLVLSDLPDRNVHEEDDHTRIFATRGRHLIKEVPLQITLRDGRATRDGEYIEIVQTEAQAEVFTMIEAILETQDRTTIAEVASALGKHKNTVQGALTRAAKTPGGLNWKGRTLSIQPRVGIMWVA